MVDDCHVKSQWKLTQEDPSIKSEEDDNTRPYSTEDLEEEGWWIPYNKDPNRSTWKNEELIAFGWKPPMSRAEWNLDALFALGWKCPYGPYYRRKDCNYDNDGQPSGRQEIEDNARLYEEKELEALGWVVPSYVSFVRPNVYAHRGLTWTSQELLAVGWQPPKARDDWKPEALIKLGWQQKMKAYDENAQDIARMEEGK